VEGISAGNGADFGKRRRKRQGGGKERTDT